MLKEIYFDGINQIVYRFYHCGYFQGALVEFFTKNKFEGIPCHHKSYCWKKNCEILPPITTQVSISCPLSSYGPARDSMGSFCSLYITGTDGGTKGE